MRKEGNTSLQAASRDLNKHMEMMIYYLVITALALGLTLGDPEVTINNGIVKISGATNCTIKNGDDLQKTTVSLEKKMVMTENPTFGLIKWNCGIERGTVISFFECADCSTYCVYNQYLEKCSTITVPIVSAVIISFLIFLILVLLSMTILKKKLTKLLINVIMFFIMRSDVKRAARIKRYNKSSNQKLEVKFKSIKYNNKIIMDEIIKRRMKLSEKDPNNEEIYAEILYNRSADYNEANRLLKVSEQRLRFSREYQRVPTPNGIGLSKAIVTGTAILAAIPQPTYQCDQMMYLKSNGRICYNNRCFDLSTYSLMLSDGQTACFNDLENNRLSIRLDNIYNIERYSKLYDTASYNITNRMTWNCYGSGKCWYGSECGMDMH